MRNFIKKLVVTLLTFAVVSMTTLTPLAHAEESTWYNQGPFEWYVKVYDTSNSSDIFGERYTAAQVNWILWSLGAFLMNTMVGGHTEVWVCILGGNISSCAESITTAFNEIIDMMNGPLLSGPLGNSEVAPKNNAVLSLFSTVGSNPISGVGYTRKLISKFNPVQEAHAQAGFGFTTGASAVVELWKISRNLSFAILVLIIIIMSFMIMFRVKISPQAVITVQSAIPKVISALILITFSYALAGFAIDLMYVVIGLLAAVITGSGLSNHTALQLFDAFTKGENAIGLLFEFWFAFVTTALASIASSINPMTLIGGILLFIFAILTILVMIWFTIKIIVLIFKNFANIVLTIVTGPIEILLGTVTQGAGFGPWFRKLLSYLAVYPLMAILFYLAFFFLAQSVNMGLTGSIGRALGVDYLKMFPFNPKLDVIQGNTWDPPLSTWAVTGDALLWAIVAFVIITLIPKTVEIVQGFVSGKPFAYGSAVGEAVGPIKGAWGATGGTLIQGIQRNAGEAFAGEWMPTLRSTLQTIIPSRLRRSGQVPRGENTN